MFSAPHHLASSLGLLSRRPAPWHTDPPSRLGRLTGPFKSASDPFTGPSLRPW